MIRPRLSASAMADVQAHRLLENNPELNEPALSGVDTAVNLLLGSVFFMWSLYQQINLQRSIHFVSVVYALFVAFMLLGWLQKRLTAAIAAGGGAVERYALNLVVITGGYLGGLVARLALPALTGGPRVGDFGFAALLLPAIALVCVIALLAQLRIISDTYGVAVDFSAAPPT